MRAALNQARYVTATCKARDIISELGIRAPSEIAIEKIAAYYKAPVRRANLPGCDGRMVRDGDLGIISVNSSIKYPQQVRFIIAHELGHFLLHPQICQFDEVDLWQSRNFNHNQKIEELEANYFAAELLIPTSLLSKDIGNEEPSWDILRALAQKYETTLSSMAIQYTRCTNESIIIIASEKGKRKWYAFSKNAKDFWLTDAEDLHHFSCAYELFTSTKTRSRSSMVSAAAWFQGYDYACKENITEDAIKASQSNFALSLIWVHDEI